MLSLSEIRDVFNIGRKFIPGTYFPNRDVYIPDKQHIHDFIGSNFPALLTLIRSRYQTSIQRWDYDRVIYKAVRVKCLIISNHQELQFLSIRNIMGGCYMSYNQVFSTKQECMDYIVQYYNVDVYDIEKFCKAAKYNQFVLSVFMKGLTRIFNGNTTGTIQYL